MDDGPNMMVTVFLKRILSIGIRIRTLILLGILLTNIYCVEDKFINIDDLDSFQVEVLYVTTELLSLYWLLHYCRENLSDK